MKRYLIIHISLLHLLSAYPSSTLFHEKPIEATVGEDLVLEVVPISDHSVVKATGYYRIKGSASFQEEQMNFSGTAWQMRISGRSLSEKGLEYCFIFNMSNGSLLAAPHNDPFDHPYSI